MKFKRTFSFLLIFLQIFTLINIKPKVVQAADTGGWLKFNTTSKQLEIKIEGMIPPPGSENQYYEYDIFGFVIRYHKQNGDKYLTQVSASSPDGSAGFKVTNYKKFTKNGVNFETSDNIMSLASLKSFFEQDFPGVDFSEITNPSSKSVFYFDAIYSVKGVGQSSYRGGVGSDRKSFGEYYMTLNGSHSYDPDIYNKSTKYVSRSSYDIIKGGVIGSKKYDTGVAWLTQAKQDINDNYNKYLVIAGSEKPNVSRTVTTNYFLAGTNKKLAPSTTKTYSVGATGENHKSSAQTISDHTYLNYTTKINGVESTATTGSNATVFVSGSNTTYEINFYYSKSVNDKQVSVKGVDSNGTTLYTKLLTKSINGNDTISDTAQTIGGYTYKGHKTNHGNGLSGLNSSKTATISLSLDKNSYEIIYYYEPKNLDSNPIPSGSIKFNPYQSGWKNSDISVKVYVDGDTEIKRTGSQLREYSYTASKWNSGYYETEIIDGQTINTWVPGYYSYYTAYSSAYCGFEQVWQMNKISVSVNSAKDINGNDKSVSLSSTSVSNNGKTSIKTEANDIQLKAELSGWTEKSKKWSSTPAPNGGSWGSTPLTATTPTPTEKYTSYSGNYKLDKTKPNATSITSPDVKWINYDKEVRIDVEENLSDLNASTLTTLTNVSYLSIPQIRLTLNSLGIKNSMHSYYYLYTINRDGIFDLDVKLVDNATNTYTAERKSYKIDKTLPNDATFSDDTREYIDDELKVTIGVSDNLSGIQKVEYAVTNSNANYSGPRQTVNITTQENIENDMNYFDYTINENGSYYFHVWSYDRAGNVKYTVSKEYKFFKINPDDIHINPFGNEGKAMRGTRFDIITEIDKFKANEDFHRSKLYYTMPNWINDDVDKKVNGNYAITTGFGEETIAKRYSKDNKLQLWNSYITPYGVPLTYDKQNNKIGNTYQIDIQLVYDKYSFGTKKTHLITKEISVIPEQVIKTQILENNK